MNENGKMGLNPNQLRPTNLPRGFQAESAQVVSPEPDAGRSSGSRALRPSPYSYYPLLPSPKEPVPVVDSFSLTAAGQPRIRTGFPSFSLRKLREPARAAVYCDIRNLSTVILYPTVRLTRRDALSNPVRYTFAIRIPNPGYIHRRSSCLAVSTPRIVNFHVHNLRIPSPGNLSMKGHSQSPTTNEPFSPYPNCLRKRHMPKPNNAAPSTAIASIESQRIFRPAPLSRIP